MKSCFRLLVASFLGVSLLSSSISAEEPTKDEQAKMAADQEHLAGTIRRYFESSGSFHSDDLLTRSQVKGLQSYLRRVGLAGIVSRPEVVSRVSLDRSRLVQLFYKKRGAEVLRVTASKIGGYGRLDMLSHEIAGLTAIQEALAANDHRRLVEYVLSRSETPTNAQPAPEQSSAEEPLQKAPQPENRGIYTVDQLIEAVTATAN